MSVPQGPDALPVMLPNGNMLIPMPGLSADGNVVSDGVAEVEPGSELFRAWADFL